MSTQSITHPMLKKIIFVLIAFVFTQSAFSQSLFDKAHDAYANKDYKLSIQLYSQYIADHGSDVSAYFNRGLAYYDLDDYEMALIDFNKVVKLDASYHKGYYQIASCQLAKELYKEAILNYTIAIGLKTDYQLAYSGRGLAKYYNKDYAGSVSDFDKAIELDPTD